jgi:16S rRNA (cytosine967-C5)-methyltransferase
VLPQENGDQITAVTARHSGFVVVPLAEAAGALGERAEEFLAATHQMPEGLLMTPARTGTDGFFVSILRRG